jgi:hypothetical protein
MVINGVTTEGGNGGRGKEASLHLNGGLPRLFPAVTLTAHA